MGGRIAAAQRFLGQPHLHKGLGLRKLQDDYFEIRVGLKPRLLLCLREPEIPVPITFS